MRPTVKTMEMSAPCAEGQMQAWDGKTMDPGSEIISMRYGVGYRHHGL